jgi:ABC-type lipopolysaccharide export system ATPase subunit
MSELLKIDCLSKSFGRHLVFNDLNLKLDAGKVYGLLGLNGDHPDPDPPGNHPFRFRPDIL